MQKLSFPENRRGFEMNDRRTRSRRRTNDYHLVYNRDTGEFIGRIVDLTPEGARLIGENPMKVPAGFACRMRLPDLINGCAEILFDMESIWSKYNKTCDWHETGYRFTQLSEFAKEAIAYLIQHWPKETNRPAVSR